MSIRAALIGGISLLLILGSAVLTLVGIREIRDGVVREAQSRVDHDLFLLASLYENELELDAERLRAAVGRFDAAGDSTAPTSSLLEVRRALGFAVLSFATDGTLAPEGLDPVLRSALAGAPSHGTILLSASRLVHEGGSALAASQHIPAPGDDPEGGAEEALFQWHAVPLIDADGRVSGIIYGGRPLNHNHDLVDRYARALFGERLYEGKPVGTVTIFLGGTRVATNVRDADGDRALGTRVSDIVREQVLGREERWQDRAWVVDSWYLSGYQPLQQPDGETIGMLYVGLLEAPYDVLRGQLVRRFAVPALVLLVLALAGTVLVVRRITRPLEQLRASADQIAAGEWQTAPAADGSYSEITSLSEALTDMQTALRERDRELRAANADLGEANSELARANENYMNTLGFVTHELKAPLANMQSYIDLVVDGFGGDLDEAGRTMLVRVRRNCEELQGMVKDYLDLSRAERDGLEPSRREIDLRADVIEPSVGLTAGLFKSRGMQLELEAPDSLAMEADPELLRIALTNYLNNAAKYGLEGGRVRLEARRESGDVTVGVWNQGVGFAAEERDQLFSKFTRLRNANTKSRKGSGLGLFLTSQILERHDGQVWAESEPGEWAKFGFRLPVAPVADNPGS
jgi:two-component system NtrC family sensor kinase